MGDFPGGPVVKNPPSNAGDEDPVQFKEKWWEKKKENKNAPESYYVGAFTPSWRTQEGKWEIEHLTSIGG